MNISERAGEWFRPFAYLGTNSITLAGAVITTSSAITLIVFWIFDFILGGNVHPYVGVLLFLILPGIFVWGLLLMPLGAWLKRRKLVKEGSVPKVYPEIDFKSATVRQALGWVFGLTMVNIMVLSLASYRGVEYMDSASFCGTTCHTVMQPEYTTFLNSPHQRVGCVQCHIGAGASWFVRSKISGLRQVYAVTFHTYDRPIPSPVEHLRPSRETCEQCHWPQKFTGDKLEIRNSFKDDEANTETTTVLLMKIGGGEGSGGVGIHGHHLADTPRIQYIASDQQRQTITDVLWTDDSGKRVVFSTSDTKPTAEQFAARGARTMDCVDCHNRPTHIFEVPERAVDASMSQGQISAELPFIKKEALVVLKENYPDRDTARLKIASALDAYYRTSYPNVYRDKRALVTAAINGVQAIYLRNIFPEMNVTWGVHPNNLGHNDFIGCFRCHDGAHTSADGRTITNDCDACHHLLAVDETNPKVLADLGVK